MMKATKLIANLLLIVLNSSYAEDGMETSISQQASSFPSTADDRTVASHEPSLRPATISPSNTFSVPSTTAPSPTKSPVVTIAPSPYGTTPLPSDSAPALLFDSCQNTHGWVLNNWIWGDAQIVCDDLRVQCFDLGNLGPAEDHCCKCKGEKCEGLCNEQDFIYQTSRHPKSAPYHALSAAPSYSNHDDDDGGIYVFVILIVCSMFGALAIVLLCGKLLQRRNLDELAQTRQTMTTRRQQQRESSVPSITEEDRYTATYEKMVTMFHIQIVQDEKAKNTAAGSIREDDFAVRTENDPEKEGHANGDLAASDEVHENSKESSFIERLSVWGSRPPPADNCCICLESYTKGERVCVPITQRCNHVFHEECIFEWIQKKNRCPLCRVDLTIDCKGVVPDA